VVARYHQEIRYPKVGLLFKAGVALLLPTTLEVDNKLPALYIRLLFQLAFLTVASPLFPLH